MEQRDYLMREVSRISLILGKIISGLLGIKQGGFSGIEYIRQTLKSELDIDINMLLSVESDRLIEFLTIEKGFNDDDIDKLLEMLFIVADDMSEDNPQRNQLYKTAIALNNHIEKSQKVVSFDRYMTLEKIKSSVK